MIFRTHNVFLQECRHRCVSAPKPILWSAWILRTQTQTHFGVDAKGQHHHHCFHFLILIPFPTSILHTTYKTCPQSLYNYICLDTTDYPQYHTHTGLSPTAKLQDWQPLYSPTYNAIAILFKIPTGSIHSPILKLPFPLISGFYNSPPGT